MSRYFRSIKGDFADGVALVEVRGANVWTHYKGGGEPRYVPSLTLETCLKHVIAENWVEVDWAGDSIDATHERYKAERERLGYHPDDGMVKTVWDGCTASSRASMLAQLQIAQPAPRHPDIPDSAVEAW